MMTSIVGKAARKGASGIRRARVAFEAARIGLDPQRSATFFPDEERKHRIRIIAELARDAFESAAVNDGYFLYGADLKRNGSARFPGMKALMEIVHRQVKSQGAHEQADLLKDKVRFSQRLREKGFPTPPIIGLARDGRIFVGNESLASPEKFIRSANRPLFLKPTRGSAGRGSCLLATRGEELLVNGDITPWEQLGKFLQAEAIIQETVEQHPVLDRLYSMSLNTMRVVTVLQGDRARVIGSFLRMGTGAAVTDNFSGSGIAIAISPTTGHLIPPGFYRLASRGRPLRHPDSGVDFEGIRMPYFDESLDTVTRLHEDIGGLISVGWDVAITPSGPTVMEGNVYWMPRFHIASDPDFLPRYTRIVEPWLRPEDRSWAAPYLGDSD